MQQIKTINKSVEWILLFLLLIITAAANAMVTDDVISSSISEEEVVKLSTNEIVGTPKPATRSQSNVANIIPLMERHDDVNGSVIKVRINVVILIYTFGYHSSRYNNTEMIFKHYRNIQQVFQEYSEFSFTIIGSEKEVSKNLTLQYFPATSYHEMSQPKVTNETSESERNYAIARKVNHGMRRAFKSENESDIIMWAGSNDYISFSFWKQVIDSYDPKRLEIFGIDNFVNGKNAMFFTLYDGHNMRDRSDATTFWVGGMFTRLMPFHYVGGAIGVTRQVFKKYPHLLKKWNHDERYNERLVLSINGVHKFNSTECFVMNIKMADGSLDTNTWKTLRKKLPHRVYASQMSASFLQQFDREYQYFVKYCALL